MLLPRVIPSLLLEDGGLVKTTKFKDPVYLGDPINVIKIFNDKQVDELVLLDITATLQGRPPPYDLLAEVSTECFMPLCYGGGVRTLQDVRAIIGLGIEKIAINSQAVADPSFIRAAADTIGSSSVVVSIDAVRRDRGRYEVVTHGGRRRTGLEPVRFAEAAEQQGAGEILLNAVDRDGTMQGYDIDLIRSVTQATSIPVVACGGAGRLAHMVEAVEQGGASGAAAGSMFVFQGRHRAVLISYPSPSELRSSFAPAVAAAAGLLR